MIELNRRAEICLGISISIIIVLWGIMGGILWLNLYGDQNPELQWLSSTPEEQGIDSAKLDELMELIENQKIAIDSLLIIRHGYIVFERYIILEEYLGHVLSGQDNMHSLYSATKSFASALVGIAIKEGFIDSVNSKVMDFFPEKTIQNLDARKKNMTLEHLLTMTTGLEWDEWTGNSAIEMMKNDNSIEYLLNLPMAYDPGTVWTYCTGASHLLSAIIKATTGYTTLEFARKYLFQPLGIFEVQWTYDRQNINHGGHGLSLTQRDMAKFGCMYLNNGTWDGKQVIPAEWVAKSTQAYYLPQENSGYGYQWWVLPQSGVYYADGMYGQRIYVAPEYDIVVVFTANIQGINPEGSLFQNILNAVY